MLFVLFIFFSSAGSQSDFSRSSSVNFCFKRVYSPFNDLLSKHQKSYSSQQIKTRTPQVLDLL
jgi:hypothetical protein